MINLCGTCGSANLHEEFPSFFRSESFKSSLAVKIQSIHSSTLQRDVPVLLYRRVQQRNIHFLPLPFVYYVLKSLIHFWLLFVVCFCGTKRPRPVVEQQFFVYCIAQVKKKKKNVTVALLGLFAFCLYTCPCAFALNIWKTKNMKEKRKALAPVPIFTTDCYSSTVFLFF